VPEDSFLESSNPSSAGGHRKKMAKIPRRTIWLWVVLSGPWAGSWPGRILLDYFMDPTVIPVVDPRPGYRSARLCLSGKGKVVQDWDRGYSAVCNSSLTKIWSLPDHLTWNQVAEWTRSLPPINLFCYLKIPDQYQQLVFILQNLGRWDNLGRVRKTAFTIDTNQGKYWYDL